MNKSGLQRTILLIICLFFWKNFIAQEINWGPGIPLCDQGIYYTHLETSSTDAIVFTISLANHGGIAGSSLIWRFRDPITNVCSQADNTFTSFVAGSSTSQMTTINTVSVTLTPDPVSRSLSLSFPSGTIGEFLILIRVDNQEEDGPANRIFQLIIREPMQLVFALDLSGSMECDQDPTNWPDCALSASEISAEGSAEEALINIEGGSRWRLLKEAVHNFLFRIDEDRQILSGDGFSVVYFAGSTLDPSTSFINIAGGERFINFADFRGSFDDFDNCLTNPSICQDMSTTLRQESAVPVLERSGTSIGEGILESLEGRFDETETDFQKVLLLFTDGEQNVSPEIRVTSGGDLFINENPTVNLIPDGDEVIFNGTSAVDDIDIYTVAMAEASGLPSSTNYLDILANNGATVFSFDDTGISALMSQVYIEIFSGATPNMIKKVTEVLAEANTSSFDVNKNVSRLMFEAHFDQPRAKNYNYTFEKNGINVQPFISKRSIGEFYATFIFDFQTIPLDSLESEGEWVFAIKEGNVIIVQRTTNEHTNVSLIATADDHVLDFEANLMEDKFRVGRTITPSIQLAYNEQPITHAAAVAIILKPGDDIGDILARAENITLNDTLSAELGGYASQKLLDLQLNDTSALDNFDSIHQQLIPLIHQGSGLYTGTYYDLDVSGVYKIIYSTLVQTNDAGVIERTKEQTINVRFGEVNLNLVDQLATINPTESTATLTVCPAFSSSDSTRLVGPGFSFAFNVEGVSVTTITDLGDGCYDLELDLGESQNPAVTITILGDTIFLGELEEFNKHGNTIDSFALYDARGDSILPMYTPLASGDTLNINFLPHLDLNIEAIAAPVKAGSIGSVMFDIVGLKANGDTVSRNWTECCTPYMVFGNEPLSNILPWNLPQAEIGDVYTLTATPYTKPKGEGLKGLPKTIVFSFDFKADTSFEVNEFVLVDPETDEVVSPLSEGAMIDLAQFETFNIIAYTNPEQVESVQFWLESQGRSRPPLKRTENVSPYALFGDFGGDFRPGTLAEGLYTLRATPYARRATEGRVGVGHRINFEVINEAAERSVLSVLPNPAEHTITIQADIDEGEGFVILQIRNISDGVPILKKRLSYPLKEKIDISAYKAGIYVIQLIMSDQIISKKFIKLKN